MSFRIEMPQLSSDGGSAALASWLVEVGDAVEKGDVIAELETDKATVELEAPCTGRIEALHVAAGTEGIESGSLLGEIAEAEGTSRPDRDEADAEGAPRPAPDDADARGAPRPDADEVDGRDAERSSRVDTERADAMPVRAGSEAGASPPTAERLRASTPLARRAAAAHGVDLGAVEGSGPGGRVVRDDVLRRAGVRDPGEASSSPPAAAQEAGAEPRSGATSARRGDVDDAPDERAPGGVEAVDPAADFEVVRLSAMRRTIARRLTESKQQVPHFYLRVRCRLDALLETRAKLNRGLAEEDRDVKISVNDFVVRAAALGLRAVPEANVQFAGDAMHVFDRVDVAVAVATEGGLVTPIVRDADRRGLVAIAEATRDLAARARAGRLRPAEYEGGSITVSNLGMYGIETVYPILNPPQACILGVGAAEEQPVVRAGEIVIGRLAVLTLAADHRAIDGAVGARLLAAIRDRLEDPMEMVL